MKRDVVISGMGAACATGTGCAALWDALEHGRDGLRPIERFSIAEFPPHVAGLWPQWDGRSQDDITTLELAVPALREAWAQARCEQAGVKPERIALVLGTCFGERFGNFNELTRDAARALGVRGPSFTVSTACSSSTAAVGLARDLIDEGVADLVIAGGVDVASRQVFAGFHALGALSPGKCAPFGEPVGMTLGEGAGFVVVESAEQAQARGVAVLSRVLGYGLSGDAHHETAPDPSGSGVARAIASALEDSGVAAGEIDFVSAHGTGTDSNDPAEWLAVRSALGEGADRVPMSATKSFLGHAQGAAGVLELIATLLCMKRGLVPPTLRESPPRPGVPADTVAGLRPRPHPVRHALKLSAGFAGANAALVVGREVQAPAVAPRRRIEIAGISAVGSHGFTVQGLEQARVLTGATPAFTLEKFVRSAPKRELDPSCKMLSAATQLALEDARVAIRGSLRMRAGLFTGSSRIPARSAQECKTSIDTRGIRAISATAFTQMVLNAPAGMCAKLCSLKGPLLVLSAGRASGLLAIVRAAEHLSRRPGADLIVAAGHDERRVDAGENDAEGAGCVVLRARDPFTLSASKGAVINEAAAAGDSSVRASGLAPDPSTPAPLRDASAQGERISGWGISSADDVAGAIARAMREVPEVDGIFSALAGPVELPRTPLGAVDVNALAGTADAASSAFAFVLAASLLRKRGARSLLVVSANDTVSCAAVLQGGSDGQ
jgi:3-oxoacyl-[acyl-carrier-protein] synthase II